MPINLQRLRLLFSVLVLAPALLLSSIGWPTAAHQQQRGLTTGTGNATANTGHYYALVIGNNAYTALPKLKTAEADAREVEKLLRETYGFQTKLLVNATRSQIVAALSAYRRELTPEANLLIYYAGHSFNDKETEKTYWLPVDAERDDSSNWIIADEITSGIRAIPARHVLVVSDSCYSGTLTRGIGEMLPRPSEREQFLQRMAAGRSRTLMASGGDEPVADNGGSGHSIFADALLRGLREMDKGQFTAAELFRSYVEESVAGRAQQTPEYNPLRNSGHEAGDFVFVRVKVGDKTVEVTVKTQPTFDPAAVELSFWETIKNSTNPDDFKAYLEQYPSGRFAALARIRTAGGPVPGKMLALDFNATKGILATNATLGEGIRLSSGSLRIESTAGSNLIMPAGLQQVGFFLGPALPGSTAPAGLTCGELTFTAGDLSAISVTRPGVTGGASTPAWQMQAFNASGAQVGETVGEGDIINGNYLFPPVPQDFTIAAASIHKMQLCSKNHLSTFGAIPIARISRTLGPASIVPSSPGTPHPGARPQQMQSRAGIEFVWLPAGSFMMGSENGSGDEKPVHRVTIGEGFYMGKYEVTQAQWQAVMGDNPSYFKGCDNCPVEKVSWDDAQAFIAKLNGQNDGYTYRLPTEAEWEYAARAGTTGDYPGDLDAIAWYADNSKWYANNSTLDHVIPVGQKQPNVFGLFDMLGNVWEWCHDVFHSSYAGAPKDGSPWMRGGDSNCRVVHGSAFNVDAVGLRFAYRTCFAPTVRSRSIGVRVVAVART